MSARAGKAPAPAAGSELAPAVSELLAPATAPRTAVQAAQRIHAVHDAMRTLGAMMELQVMESAHVIRRECGDRAAFDAFAAEQDLERLASTDRLWAMALAHEAQRANRAVREMLQARPAETIRRIQEYVEAGAEERIERLDETDERAVEVLGQPPSKLRGRVRQLLELEERLAADEDERAAGREAGGVAPHPAAGSKQVIDELTAAERHLAAAMEILGPGGAELSELARERTIALTDTLFGYLDRVIARATATKEFE